VLSSLQTARGDGEGLDEVTISLLVAARNGELLYDISKWGEDIGLAARRPSPRTKTTLEDMGLIDTEKVPIDVGRPRLRLMLGDERLEDASTDELASVAQSLLRLRPFSPASSLLTACAQPSLSWGAAPPPTPSSPR